VKWSEGLSNRVSIIIRRYIDHMRFAAIWLFCLSHSFGSILYHFMYGCMFCMLMFNFVQVSLMYSYCYVCSVLGILFHCVVLCIVCVYMCTVLLLLGVNPIAVNRYII
jgi:hypothetical protein